MRYFPEDRTLYLSHVAMYPVALSTHICSLHAWASFTADFRRAPVTCSSNAKPGFPIWKIVWEEIKRSGWNESLWDTQFWQLVGKYPGMPSPKCTPTLQTSHENFFLITHDETCEPNQRSDSNNYKKHVLALFRISVGPYFRQGLKESHSKTLNLLVINNFIYLENILSHVPTKLYINGF
jgi:hypothetical protein